MKRKRRQSSTPAVDARAEALQRFEKILPPDEFEQLQAAMAIPLRPAIRLNPLKVDFKPGQFPSDLQKRYGWQVEAVPFCDTGWWLNQNDTPAGKTIEHRLGHYYIQDAASMLPVELFDFDGLPEEPLILDLAASPGGKTTHLLARNGERGLVLANDSSRERITALKLVLSTWGGLHSAVTQFPGEKFGKWFPETFDRVLLDAPCSMESLHSSESHPMRPISVRERSQLAKRQYRLLESAFRCVRCGGQLVYSTCTLAPEEDEAVLDQLLQSFPEAVEIVDVRHRLPRPAPGMSSFEDIVFDDQVSHAIRLYPHICGTSGFFAALLRKKTSSGSIAMPHPQQPFERTGLEALSASEQRKVCDIFRNDYGFNLDEILDSQHLTLWHRAGNILVIPQLYLERFSGLACRMIGLPLAEENGSELLPSHEWATRFSRCFSRGFYRLPDEHLPAWLRGEDVPLDKACEATTEAVIVTDASGRQLGRGRMQEKRLKNLLPRRLVL